MCHRPGYVGVAGAPDLMDTGPHTVRPCDCTHMVWCVKSTHAIGAGPLGHFAEVPCLASALAALYAVSVSASPVAAARRRTTLARRPSRIVDSPSMGAAPRRAD